MTVADQSVRAFLDGVATGGVTPGGGATAAVAGAAGAALLEMVCANTLGQDGNPDEREELVDLRELFADRREHLLALADEDVGAVEALMAAYRTPDGDGRKDAIRSASVRATEVPVEIAEACQELLVRAPTVIEAGNPNAVADGVIGLHLAYGALEAMVYTVDVNLGAIDDGSATESLARRANTAAQVGETAYEESLDRVADRQF